ncbi:MAG: hypothetical protein KA797_03755, partial [Chitinophagales bacterium]|nr:hypothetical protein [Chitinophagales bacterium]
AESSKKILAIGDWRLAIGDWRLAIGEFNVFLALWRHQFILNAIKKTFQLKSVDYFEYEGTHHSPAPALNLEHQDEMNSLPLLYFTGFV